MSERMNMEELRKGIALFMDEVERIARTDLDDQIRTQRVSSAVLQAFQVILQTVHVPNPIHTATIRCPHTGSCGKPVTVSLQVGSSHVCPKCYNAVDISLT